MVRRMCIWDQPPWPEMRWDASAVQPVLARAARAQGRVLGRMDALGFDLQTDTQLRMLTDAVLDSSAIEGESLSRVQVRSSVARQLGLDVGGLVATERHVDGVVEMLLDATVHASEPLTGQRLCRWQAALFPSGQSGLRPVRTGAFRTGPVEVVSGAYGKERVHFEGPPAERLDTEIRMFLDAFESPPPARDGLVHAGLMHLWCVTVHPFEDGNGRVARAVADMALTRSDRVPSRFYSLSSQILKEREAYHAVLERTQRRDLDVTDWLLWFLECLERSLLAAESDLEGVFARTRFWQRVSEVALSERQTEMVKRLLSGFEGKLTSGKWAKLMKVSQDTAYRDMLDLIGKGVLRKDAAGGRSTSYSLVWEEE